MELLKKTILTFALVIAGITVSSTIFLTIFVPEVQLGIMILWEIIIMSAVCSLGNLLFYSRREISKKKLRIRMIIHYIYINAVVLSGAFIWEWITPGYILQLIVIMILIAAVYAAVMLVNISKEIKIAEDLNKRLNKLNTGEKGNE